MTGKKMGKKAAAFVLLAAGLALGAVAARAELARLAAERSLDAALVMAQQTRARLDAERHRLERRVLAAAQIKPLLAALDDNVDGATLVDLFRSEDWWRDIRQEFPVTRLVVDSDVLASIGSPNPGTKDRDVIKEARKNPVASAVVSIDNQATFLVAGRLAAMPDKSPVLVLARPVGQALLVPAGATTALPPRSPVDFGLPAGALVLLLAGIALVTASRPTPTVGAAALNPAMPHTPDIRGSARGSARDSARDSTDVGGRADPAAATDVVGWRADPAAATRPDYNNLALAPAPLPVPATPAPAGPPRKPTVPGGVPVADNGTPGQVFGRYHLLDRLGQGGMADVFTAVAHGVEGFTRVFVLKRLRPELSQDKEAVAQFVDEARMQSSLVHSNIVPVFDFGRVGHEYFMTQEYIVGRDLVRLIARYYEHVQRTIPPRLAYFIAHETLHALQYAHTKSDREGHHLGIVHRDVSAGNIIMSAQGEVKLADFGVVKSNRRESKTQMGMVKGNANFMSPEQARGQNVDARTDLFSVALVLYYCLTNKLFYDGDNDLEVLHKAATGPTAEHYDEIRQLPAPACDLLGRALAPDLADRFQSAGEFADVLAPHIGGAKAEAERLMQTLFGVELRKEAA